MPDKAFLEPLAPSAEDEQVNLEGFVTALDGGIGEKTGLKQIRAKKPW